MSLRSWFGHGCHLGLPCLVILVGAIGIQGGDRTSAQVTADPSVGTQVQQIDNTTLNITGGTTVGNTNLFHSFSNFSIPSEQVVNFDNALTINNILVRVTGRNPSDIQGTLQTQGNANFFLMNPNGIIFGQNASLNVNGSFIGTTANAIQFPGGGEFSMTSPVNPLNPLLRVNPSAFLFNQISSQPVQPIQVNEAFLFVPESQSLVLLGGNVNLERAIVFAPDGRIELGGLAAGGTVGLNIDNNNFRLSFPESVARADVSLTNFTTVSASGEGGGGIQIQGRRVTFDASDITVNTLVSKSGGTLGINASESVKLLRGSRLVTETTRSGTAGDLRIETGELIVQDGSQISASTSLQSTGGGGTLFVNARDSIRLIGTSPIIEGEKPTPSGLFTRTQGAGNAGELKIETGQLIVRDGAQVSASTSKVSTGDGGIVSVNARDSIQLIGTQGEIRSGLFVGTESSGNAGNLNIETGQLIVEDGARISASTSKESTGQGGTMSVKARDSIKLIGTKGENRSGLFVETEAIGNAGNLNIETGQLIVKDGAQVSASTSEESTGQGGTVSVKARDSIQLIGTQGENRSGLSVETKASGNAGNLEIETGQLIVQDGARISANTRGQGEAGTLSVTADSIKLIGTSQMGASGLFVGTEAIGNAGNLNIETGQLTVQDGAQVSANTRSQGRGGTLSVAADSIQLIGTSQMGASGLFVGTEASGNAGNLNIETGQLIVQDGAQVSASTSEESTGQGGTVSVNARDSIQLIGTQGENRSGLSVETKASGNAGNLNIETGQLIVKDGAQVSASTSEKSTGQGGTVSVNARDSIQLIGRNGESRSGLFVGTESSGNAGNLNIETGQLIVQDGARISASTSEKSTGEGGSIIVKTGELNVNNADITVSSQGTKKAGDLEITARSIKLDNQGKLIGQANSGDGGNITLNLQDLLLLGPKSQISTSAEAAGNGGNITINVPDGFIVAKPNENSDITANALSGSGGRVTIKATKIFGIAPLTTEDLKKLRPTDSKPGELQTNDITAISQTRPDLSGIVEINTLDVDPNRGLINLPAVPVDTKVAQACQARTAQNQSSFTITGRGGLPPNPRTEPLSPDAVQLDWVTLNSKGENRVNTNVSNQANSSSPAPIVEAQGWVINAKGEVVLTADAPAALPHSSWLTPASCS